MRSIHIIRLTTVLLAGALASACTTTGTGTAISQTGAITGTFTWRSDDGVQGDMTAVLSTGDTYRGPFFQITQQTRVAALKPLWNGWEGRRHWREWDDWGADTFNTTTYTGTVLANLKTASGALMRCRFKLVHPTAGLSDGGSGRCQLAGGTVILAAFDRQ